MYKSKWQAKILKIAYLVIIEVIKRNKIGMGGKSSDVQRGGGCEKSGDRGGGHGGFGGHCGFVCRGGGHGGFEVRRSASVLPFG